MKKIRFLKILFPLILILVYSIPAQNLSNNSLEKNEFTLEMINQVKEIRNGVDLNMESSSGGKKCLSMILHEARRNWDKLTDEGKLF